MASPLVSVITPMWNGASFIAQAIESVLAQTFGDWEMIVADDGSTDGGAGAAIVSSYAARDGRVKLILLPKNGGSAAARNAAMKAAQGRCLAFLDSDDVWHDDFLAVMLNHIKENKNERAAVYFCGYRRMDSACAKEVLPPYAFEGERTYRQLLRHCPIFPSAAIVDAKKLKSPVLFNESLKALRDDYVYWLEILKAGFCAVGFSDILVDYRMREDSATASKLKMIRPQWNIYRRAEGLNAFASAWYLLCWAANGAKKYKLSLNRTRHGGI